LNFRRRLEDAQPPPSMGDWPSRTVGRHRMPHPWHFHGWAAANFPRHVHPSRRNRPRSRHVVSMPTNAAAPPTKEPQNPLEAAKSSAAVPAAERHGAVRLMWGRPGCPAGQSPAVCRDPVPVQSCDDELIPAAKWFCHSEGGSIAEEPAVSPQRRIASLRNLQPIPNQQSSA
jgi:hypothetical protein